MNPQAPLTAAIEEWFEYADDQNKKIQACKPKMISAVSDVENGNYTAGRAVSDLTKFWAEMAVGGSGLFSKWLDIMQIASSPVRPPSRVTLTVYPATPTLFPVTLELREPKPDVGADSIPASAFTIQPPRLESAADTFRATVEVPNSITGRFTGRIEAFSLAGTKVGEYPYEFTVI